MFISKHLWDFFSLCKSITYFMPNMLWINMYSPMVWLTQGSHPWTIALYRLFIPCDKRRCEGSLNSTLTRHLTYSIFDKLLHSFVIRFCSAALTATCLWRSACNGHLQSFNAVCVHICYQMAEIKT